MDIGRSACNRIAIIPQIKSGFRKKPDFIPSIIRCANSGNSLNVAGFGYS